MALAALACTGAGQGPRASGTAFAEAPPATVEERIRAVENGLLPSVRVAGRTEPMALGRRMLDYGVPGVSVAVVHDGRLEWGRGYGVRDAETAEPIDERTLFQAASISKPVAVTAMLRLVEEGVLDLDAPVNEYLETWQLPENDLTASEPVTLRWIASHTAGLTIHGFPGYEVGEALPTVPQILDGTTPANTLAVRVDKLPGESFRYSGGGTTILQQVLVDVTGRPFPELMRELVLDPLGMRHSTYEQPLPDELAVTAASAHAGRGDPIEGRWHVYPEMAAAGLWTTPSDLCRFALAIQAAAAGKESILSPDTVAEMLQPVAGGPVGLGLFVESDGETLRFGHGGSNRGFRARLVAYARHGEGAAVMTNGSRGGALADEVLNGIAAVYGWPGFLAPARLPVVVGEAVLDRLAGTYTVFDDQHVRFDRIVIRHHGETLTMIFGERPPVEIIPESETAWFSLDGLEVSFGSGERGIPTLAVEVPGGPTILASRSD